MRGLKFTLISENMNLLKNKISFSTLNFSPQKVIRSDLVQSTMAPHANQSQVKNSKYLKI